MGAFDRLRYGIALFLVMFAPASVAFWFAVHPLAGYWRRVGARWGYAAGIGLSVSIAVLGYRTRGWIAGTDLGKYMFTTGSGLALLVLAGVFRGYLKRQLRVPVQLGVPELAPDTHPGRLLTEGVYARLRHPRYVQMLIALLGWALLANYGAGYVAVLFTVAVIASVIPLEERELAARFGADYEAYRRRVPALVPRLRRVTKP
jgi:protein-S-isoprenylcysteine O-methyltransferase Ste14